MITPTTDNGDGYTFSSYFIPDALHTFLQIQWHFGNVEIIFKFLYEKIEVREIK